MELNIVTIKGKFRDYSAVTVPEGYCFYDVDDEEPLYMTGISTPILNESEIKRKFILVQGNADKLNEKPTEVKQDI